MDQRNTDDDIVEPKGAEFKIFTGALKTFEREGPDGVSRKMLSCTASSTIKDLHGDEMTADCVAGMAPQAKGKSMTIFLNHSYKWPEDVFGKTTDARIVSRSNDADGNPIYDLDLEIQLNEANTRATESWRAIKDEGIKAGISIGALIDDYEFIDEEEGWWGGLRIKAVNLLEASVVGIPANQRSWVVNALKALGAPKPIIQKALGQGEPVKKTEDPKPEPTPEPTPPPVVEASITDVEASAAPSGESQDESDKSVDTPDPADEQDATESVTATDVANAVESLKAAGVSGELLDVVLGLLEGATAEVVSLRSANAALAIERDEARQEVRDAAEIVEQIARTPLGRKAGFAGPVATFRSRYGGYYDEGFLKLLEERNNASE